MPQPATHAAVAIATATTDASPSLPRERPLCITRHRLRRPCLYTAEQNDMPRFSAAISDSTAAPRYTTSSMPWVGDDAVLRAFCGVSGEAFEAALQTVDDSGSRQTLSYKCAVRPEPG